MRSVFSIFRLNVLSLALAAIGTTAIMSCSKLDNDDRQTTPVAGLMAFNLAPEQAGLVLTLNGNSLTGYPLPYTNYTGGYLSVFPGSRVLEAFSSNSPSGLPIATASAVFDAEKYYSAFTVGAGNHYRNIIVHDDFDTLPANGKAYVRYVNALIDSTKPATVVISANGSAVVNQPVVYGSVGEFAAISPGEVNVALSSGDIAANRTITLEQNKVYTVLLTGLPGVTPESEMIKFIANGLLTEQESKQSSARSAAR